MLEVRRWWSRTASCTWWSHRHELLLPRGRHVAHLRAVHVLRSTVLVHGWREGHLAHELLRYGTVWHGATLHARRHLHGLDHAGLSAVWHALWLRLAAWVLVRSTAVWLVHHSERLLLWTWSRARLGSGTRSWSRYRSWSCGSGSGLRWCHGHLTRVDWLWHGLWCLCSRMHAWLHHTGVARDKQASAIVHGAARRWDDKVLTVWLATERPHGSDRLGVGNLADLERVEVFANVQAAGTRGGLLDNLVTEEGIGWRLCRG